MEAGEYITHADVSRLPHTHIEPTQGWVPLKLRELWEYRELLYFLIWRDIKVRYKQTIIGTGWAIIQPLFAMFVFTLFFGKLAKIPSEGLPYPVFYYSGLLLWIYFANALISATNTMIENQRVITKVYFPRIILPLTAVLSGLIDFGIAFTILAGMMLLYEITPTVMVITVPLFLLLAVITALGVGLWLSGLNAIYRDVRYVVPFLVQFWMFASPVVYPGSLVPKNWQWLYGLNPMTGVIEGFRWALLGHGRPPLLLSASIPVMLLILFGGLFYFRRIERTIADVV
jgi:lipopolysaccharide transport system permease protein